MSKNMLEIIVNLSFVLRYDEIMRHRPLLSIVEQLRLIREKEKWISPIFSAGAIGGSAAGAAAKQYSLGTLGNAIAGAIGGGMVGQLIGAVAETAVEGWVGNFAGGAVGGAVLMVLVGLIRGATSKPA
jgi:hypothetical protein